MSQWHEIFCKSASPITRAVIAGTASDTWYGEGNLRFTPDTADPAIDDLEWDHLTVNLPGTVRPIIFSKGSGADLIRGLLEGVEERTGTLPASLRTNIAGASQVIGVELFPEYMDDDSWEMLDLVQSFIMSQSEGVLLAPDGIYDEKLQVILEIG